MQHRQFIDSSSSRIASESDRERGTIRLHVEQSRDAKGGKYDENTKREKG